MLFADAWLWLIFIGIGLVLVLLELIIGVDTGFDLVCLGSAFIIGGLATWPAGSWILTLIVTLAICVLYLALGRRYVHRLTAAREQKTNIDTILGKKGVVLQSIAPNSYGLVKVDNEEWRARAEEPLEPGREIIVTEIRGVTLTVVKT
jgi:membrane protein implicated in regulation of membrane protease activity